MWGPGEEKARHLKGSGEETEWRKGKGRILSVTQQTVLLEEIQFSLQ